MENEYTITCSAEFTFIFSDSANVPFDRVSEFVKEMLPGKIKEFLGADQAIVKDIRVFPSVLVEEKATDAAESPTPVES